MTNEKFGALFGGKARKPEELLTQHHMDLAASVQAVTEEIVLRLARSVRKETGARDLCLAGGVALTCVATGKLLREKIFDNIWVQPAAGDAGGAVGAAYAAYHGFMGQPRKLNGHMDGMAGSYLGPDYTDDEIAERLTAVQARFTRLDRAQMIEQTAQALAEEKAIGWMQGRMEFGPRALGGRSILGDPRSPSMQKPLKEKTGFSVLVNTSFNVRGEPIVCTPEDAFRCFMGSEIEVLVVGNCLLRKEDQDPALKLDYKNAFELD